MSKYMNVDEAASYSTCTRYHAKRTRWREKRKRITVDFDSGKINLWNDKAFYSAKLGEERWPL